MRTPLDTIQFPSESDVISQLQSALLQSGACKSESQANQVATDIVDEVGWDDLSFAKSIVDSLNSGKPLSADLIAKAQDFTKRLPSDDQQILNRLLNGGK